MPGFAVRWLVGALGLWLAQALVPGVEIRSTGTLLVAALLLGLVNAFVRPLLVLLTLPITVLTLGLFLWFINAAMLGLVAKLIDGFDLHGLASALVGALVISVTSWIASWYVGSSGRVEVMIVRRGG
jgi:putative membrane protein